MYQKWSGPICLEWWGKTITLLWEIKSIMSFFEWLWARIWPQGYKTFFVILLRLRFRTRNLCSTEFDTKNRGYKSFGVHSLLSLIWSTYSNIITYGVARDVLKMHKFRELQSQTDLVGTQNTYLCKLHSIKQLNEGVKSQVPYIGHTFGHAQHIWGGSKMKCKLQKHVYE